MSSSRLRPTELALIAALAAAPGAADPARIDALPKRLPSDEGVVVFAIEPASRRIELSFEGPGGELLELDEFSDRELVFARVPAGTWTLKAVVHDRKPQPLRQPDGPIGFEAVAGKLAYGGDLELRYAAPSFKAIAGGFNLDALGDQARARRVDPRLLDAMPLVLTGRAAAEAKRRGLPLEAASVEAFVATLAPRSGKDHAALVARVFERYGVPQPTLGAKRKELIEQLEKVGAADARTFITGDEFGYVRFAGIWGNEGRALNTQLLFAKDQLVAMRLRSLAANGVFEMPADDVLDDVEGWLDGR